MAAPFSMRGYMRGTFMRENSAIDNGTHKISKPRTLNRACIGTIYLVSLFGQSVWSAALLTFLSPSFSSRRMAISCDDYPERRRCLAQCSGIDENREVKMTRYKKGVPIGTPFLLLTLTDYVFYILYLF